MVVAGYWGAPFERDHVRAGSRYILADRPDDRSVSSEAALASGMRRGLAELRASGKAVMVLGDVPRLRFYLLKVAYAAQLPVRAALMRWLANPPPMAVGIAPARAVIPPTGPGDRIVRQVATGMLGVRYEPLMPRFCSVAGCRFASGGVPIYSDLHHVTPMGAELALDGMRLDPPDSGVSAAARSRPARGAGDRRAAASRAGRGPPYPGSARQRHTGTPGS